MPLFPLSGPRGRRKGNSTFWFLLHCFEGFQGIGFSVTSRLLRRAVNSSIPSAAASLHIIRTQVTAKEQKLKGKNRDMDIPCMISIPCRMLIPACRIVGP